MKKEEFNVALLHKFFLNQKSRWPENHIINLEKRRDFLNQIQNFDFLEKEKSSSQWKSFLSYNLTQNTISKEYLEKNSLIFSQKIQYLITELKKKFYLLIFTHGILNKHLSQFPKPKEALIASFQEDTFNFLTDQEIQDMLPQACNFFEALNGAFFLDGVFIQVNQNIKLSKPIYILHIQEENNEPKLITIKNKIHLKSFSHTEIIEEFITLTQDKKEITKKDFLENQNPPSAFTEDKTSVIVNTMNSFHLESHAQLNYSCIQNTCLSSGFVQNIKTFLDKEAHLENNFIHLGSRLSQSQIEIHLRQKGACVSNRGLSFLLKKQQVNTFTQMKHLASYTSSLQNFKGILSGPSQNTFIGKQLIEKKAKKTHSHQISKNLLLDDQAKADVSPQLEVKADDAKATHGAAIGQLDSESLFYLMSRGLNQKIASSLLLESYIEETLMGIKTQEVKEKIKRIIKAQIHEIKFL